MTKYRVVIIGLGMGLNMNLYSDHYEAPLKSMQDRLERVLRTLPPLTATGCIEEWDEEAQLWVEVQS